MLLSLRLAEVFAILTDWYAARVSGSLVDHELQSLLWFLGNLRVSDLTCPRLVSKLLNYLVWINFWEALPLLFLLQHLSISSKIAQVFAILTD